MRLVVNILQELEKKAAESWTPEDVFRQGYEQALRDVQCLIDEEASIKYTGGETPAGQNKEVE